MVVALSVEADLEFTVEVPGSTAVTGVLTGSGNSLTLRVSDPFAFAGRSDAATVRGLADGLANAGLTIRVVTASGPLVALGATRTSWLQRTITGSRHIRVERGAGLWPLVRSRVRATQAGALPTAELAPPPTLFPVAPTMARHRRHRVTTTHDPAGGGFPRLVVPLGPYPRAGDQQQVFALRADVTTIGSGADCDIRLPGLEPLHAEIRHDDADEFLLVRSGPSGQVRVNGAPVGTAVLRTGTGVDLGDWHLSYYREEYADHGRPYGGRIGGEKPGTNDRSRRGLTGAARPKDHRDD